jgi:hypothetical protein
MKEQIKEVVTMNGTKLNGAMAPQKANLPLTKSRLTSKPIISTTETKASEKRRHEKLSVAEEISTWENEGGEIIPKK